MRTTLVSCAILLILTIHARGAAPADADVQGLYEGTAKADGAERKVEARVVAVGKGKFKVLVREQAEGGKVAKYEVAGATEGDAVTFKGRAGDAAVAGTYAAGVITGTAGKGGTFELKRVVREAPGLGAKPPAGAIVLLDGKSFDEMTKGEPKPTAEATPWKTIEGAEGAIEIPRGGMNSKRTFDGSFKLHVEFKCPLMPAATGQGRGNSGCYMPNGDEVQVLDSFGMTTYTGGGCGGLYKYKDPDAFDEFSLASLPPLQWQSYDIDYRVESAKDAKGKATAKITVIHNGIKIHDNAVLNNPAKSGRFQFQDHGNPVQYRNIWVVPDAK